MPQSLRSPETLDAFAQAAAAALDPDPARRPFPSPEDWRDCPIYFLMVDRFNNPTRKDPASKWDAPFGGFQGGAFNGIREQLDYIKDMGFAAIWLSPIQKNLGWDPSAYHGYGIHDFLAIEPRFASNPAAAQADPRIAEQEFRALVDAAHERGLYIILDVVLNHVGNVFGYASGAATDDNSKRPWKGLEGDPYTIFWRDANGVGQTGATTLPANPSRDAVVWPLEFHDDNFFRRRGVTADSHPLQGDFEALKELVTESSTNGRFPVREVLIRACQYMVARYDVDAFRIDTLKYIEPQFARVFGNAMREYALAIGKRNFFTFGEVADEGNEALLAEFVGRDTVSQQSGEPIGVDAVLDFPLRGFLARYAKANDALPSRLAEIYEKRKQAQKTRITSHGEASEHFVTFLDNHDNHDFRFSPISPAGTTTYDPQFSLGVGCLLALQGIPCIYYGTEHGLPGMGLHTGDFGVREALWGKQDAFSRTPGAMPKFYTVLQDLLRVRATEPALRYGRQYLRPISGDEKTFAISNFPNGVLAFSRVLNDREIVVVANADTSHAASVSVIVDGILNPPPTTFRILYTNQAGATPPAPVHALSGGDLVVFEVDGTVNRGGPLTAMRVTLQPMEIQILGV